MKSRPRDSRPGFAEALRDAINARDVTLAWLHDRLRTRGNRVSMARLSYWRSGARHPEGAQSLAALGDIEELLDLPDGALSGLLRPTNRTGPLGPTQFPIAADDIEQAVKDAFAALDFSYPDTSRNITTHSVSDVDAQGNIIRCVTRSIVQSTVGTITAIPFLEVTPGVRTTAPRIEAVAGGRISSRYSHPGGEVHAALFELETPLTAPETTVIEWSLTFPRDYPSLRETGHAVSRQCRELLMWTRFDPAALPDWCEERVDTPTGTVLTPLTLRGTSIHQIRRSFGPGLLGLSWGYGPRPDDAQA